MQSKIRAKLQKITERYISGNATEEEKAALNQYYELFEEAPNVDNKLSREEQQKLGTEIYARILRNRVRTIPFYKRQWFSIAASILVITSIATVLVLNKAGKNQVSTPLTAKVTDFNERPYTRNLILADSSRIILHANSTLTLQRDFATGKTREVTLVGEAFFDIRHNAKRPFIIHTGKIKTTVLGTAFNIKAYPGQKIINVSVIRGKVKVESSNAVLAVLTPNKQLTANLAEPKQKAVTQSTNVSKVISWTAEGMNFDSMTFDKLAKILDQRYGVKILFKNPALQKCPITGSFTGTETLEDILAILSQTRGTVYQIKDKEVIIDGTGCN